MKYEIPWGTMKCQDLVPYQYSSWTNKQRSLAHTTFIRAETDKAQTEFFKLFWNFFIYFYFLNGVFLVVVQYELKIVQRRESNGMLNEKKSRFFWPDVSLCESFFLSAFYPLSVLTYPVLSCTPFFLICTPFFSYPDFIPCQFWYI